MNTINKKGFTLVELIATIVLLALVMSIAGFSINRIIVSSKKKEYELLLQQISSGVENFYQECTYVTKDCPIDNGFITVSIKTLLDNGFLKPNSKNEEKKNDIVNPFFSYKNRGENASILECKISFTYSDGKIKMNNESGSVSKCPSSNEYNNKKVSE